jgi:pimeloyl-ACP methyl ester carboxylesterase
MSISIRHSNVAISDGTLHVAEAGPTEGSAVIFLHGWPQDWSAWTKVMSLAASDYRCIAIDLPGIGGSKLATQRGDKFYLARLIDELINELGLQATTLVGHDAGGMITFAYLKQFSSLRCAVIMDTVIPGISPWDRVLSNPYLWHFAFHNIPNLPETLVRDNIGAYFDYFYEAISAKPDLISAESRERYVQSYSAIGALSQGFELYRALSQDASENVQTNNAITTPTLYLRGAQEGGNIEEYRIGLMNAGLQRLSVGLIADSGHFPPEEAPEEVWREISSFLSKQ